MLTNDVPRVGPSRKLSDLFELCCSTILTGVVVVLVFYGSLTHFRSFRAQSVNLATAFLGKPPRQFTST